MNWFVYVEYYNPAPVLILIFNYLIEFLSDFWNPKESISIYLFWLNFASGVLPVLNYAPRHGGVLGEWRYRSTHSLTSVLDGGGLSASRLVRFAPKEKAPGTLWIGGWEDTRTGLDTVSKR
jgi:hypothetical protein